eukprot:m.187088 g.187088  ORF g.187088 m.187088 type:complete len:122 (+) comp15600_c0_seq2:55-420(+)
MDALNTEDNSIKTEIVSLITKYLEEEGFHSAAMVLRDEASERQNIRVKKQTQFKKLRSCIMDGLWDEVVPICKQVGLYIYSISSEIVWYSCSTKIQGFCMLSTDSNIWNSLNAAKSNKLVF